MKQARLAAMGLAGVIILGLPGSGALAYVTTVPTGPIYSASDAQTKCKAACWRGHMMWGGAWRTARGPNSECDCLGGGGSNGGSVCSAPSVRQCHWMLDLLRTRPHRQMRGRRRRHPHRRP